MQVRPNKTFTLSAIGAQADGPKTAGLKNVYMYWPLLVATLVTKFMTFIVVHKPAQMHGGALPEALHFWELHQSRSKR